MLFCGYVPVGVSDFDEARDAHCMAVLMSGDVSPGLLLRSNTSSDTSSVELPGTVWAIGTSKPRVVFGRRPA